MIDVIGNDWSVLVPPSGARWQPTERVTVCVPAHDPSRLDRMLDALELQTYPTDLLEVVIADDGSEPPLVADQDRPFPVRVVRLERTSSFGAGRARNAAARAATGTLLVFLDADIVPERHVIASYARWFVERDDVFVMGLCRFADTDELDDASFRRLLASGRLGDHFGGREVDDQQWRENTFRRTDDLRDEAHDAFRIVIGATFAVRADRYWAVGGFRELGIRGIEDTEFGYRVHADGAVMVPDRDAVHWHQGRRSLSAGRMARVEEIRRPYVERLIPVPGFRTSPPDPPNLPVSTVPSVVVHGSRAAVVGELASDQTMVEAGTSLEAPDGVPFVAAYCQIWIPDGAVITADGITDLMSELDERRVGAVLVPGPGGRRLVAVRTRALRRAVRETGMVASYPLRDELCDHVIDRFGVWYVGPRRASVRWAGYEPVDASDAAGARTPQRVVGVLVGLLERVLRRLAR